MKHRYTIGIATAAGALSLGAAGARKLWKLASPPTVPSFYQPPDPLPPGYPGDLIAWEPIEAPAGARVWRILYRSTGRTGAPLAVSGLIAAPDGKPQP